MGAGTIGEDFADVLVCVDGHVRMERVGARTLICIVQVINVACVRLKSRLKS